MKFPDIEYIVFSVGPDYNESFKFVSSIVLFKNMTHEE